MFPTGSSESELRVIGGLGHCINVESNDSEGDAELIQPSAKSMTAPPQKCSIEVGANSGEFSLSQALTQSRTRSTQSTEDSHSSSYRTSLEECEERVRGDAGFEALSPSDFPPTRLFCACASVLTTPLGRDFVLDPLKLNSPNTLFSATMPTEILSINPRPAMFLDIGGSERGENSCLFLIMVINGL